MRSQLLSFALGLSLLVPMAAAAAMDRPIVVELFTSEGCSSCPPADAVLTDLAQNRKDVLPLAFHVTYWDSLGWRDPFSLTAATERQASYDGQIGAGTFTPQIVVEGRTSVIGSRRGEVSAAIGRAVATGPSIPVSLSRTVAGLTVDVGSGSGNGKILLVGFDHQRTTSVGRGENGGRTLTESNIVRSFKVLAPWNGASVHVAAAIDAGEDAAVILQAVDGRILGAGRLSTISS